MDVAAAPAEEQTRESGDADAVAALHRVVADGGEYARSLGRLVASEAELAKINLSRLLVVGLLVPAIAGSAVLAVEALLVTLLARWLGDWAIATAIIAGANLALLGSALWLLRGWWRSLTLPRSRAAISSFWVPPR